MLYRTINWGTRRIPRILGAQGRLLSSSDVVYRYASDVVKGFGMPVIHVNGEDVESVHKVFKFAVQYRQKF
jgi:transketolase N-terminal domain/subunit